MENLTFTAVFNHTDKDYTVKNEWSKRMGYSDNDAEHVKTKENADVIAEALTIYHKLGITPSQMKQMIIDLAKELLHAGVEESVILNNIPFNEISNKL